MEALGRQEVRFFHSRRVVSEAYPTIQMHDAGFCLQFASEGSEATSIVFTKKVGFRLCDGGDRRLSHKVYFLHGLSPFHLPLIHRFDRAPFRLGDFADVFVFLFRRAAFGL